mmetsp:Transcript_310/g.505  ORF Transcript_310/g.505 Transcript_310/m.505 type:complete len:888 (+) Transcript_310:157-2820(+)
MKFAKATLVSFLVLSGDTLLPGQQHLQYGVEGFVFPSTSSRTYSRNTAVASIPEQERKEAVGSSSILPPPPQKKKIKKQKKKDDERQMSEQMSAEVEINGWNGKSIPEKLPKLSELMKKTNSEDLTNTLGKQQEYSRQKNVARRKNEIPKKRNIRNPKSMNEPWKASYMASNATQKRIKDSIHRYPKSFPMKRATAVLETLLMTLPENCNEANVVCALTLSAKVLATAGKTPPSQQFRSYLIETLDILHELVSTEQLSVRQLCNAVWAIAKHYNRDPSLLPPPPITAATSTDDVLGVAETWVLQNETKQSAEKRLEETVDKIASQLTTLLRRDSQKAGARMPKVGELAMASWAFAIVRPRTVPPGWMAPRRLGRLPQTSRVPQSSRVVEYITFEQWANDNGEPMSEGCTPDATDQLFDAIGAVLCSDDDENKPDNSLPLETATWNELANIVWACASHGQCQTPMSDKLVMTIAQEASRRLNEGSEEEVSSVLPRDISQMVWALGTLQTDNFKLGDDLVRLVDATAGHCLLGSGSSNRSLVQWSCPDLVQLAVSMAHARIDHIPLLNVIFEESLDRLRKHDQHTQIEDPERRSFLMWEISVLLWAQARLNLKSNHGGVFEDFAASASRYIVENMDSDNHGGLGSQEQANIAWSLTVLENYDSPDSIALLQRIFRDAATTSKAHKVIQLEHAHQLWQALFLLEDECPEAVKEVPKWFYQFLEKRWKAEKSRTKLSSARHRSLSDTLDLMGISHYNEHDEDIDVAIVLKEETLWTNSAAKSDHKDARHKVAVEFDGPSHFTREENFDGNRWPQRPRALGHTVLKYRLLKKQGWVVVRVPYYEFDKIPFWASMERQRYLQRLLKTHANIKFSTVDVSEYKAIVPNRGSRFD